MVIHKIIRFGNSNGVALPAAFLREMGIAAGSYVSLALLQENILVIVPLERQALLASVRLLHSQNPNENTSGSFGATPERNIPVVQHGSKSPVA